MGCGLRAVPSIGFRSGEAPFLRTRSEAGCRWAAAAAQGSGNTTALVGTPDQVAEAIAKYYKLGVSGVLIRGFEPFDDAIHFGEELIPLIREKVERVDQE